MFFSLALPLSKSNSKVLFEEKNKAIRALGLRLYEANKFKQIVYYLLQCICTLIQFILFRNVLKSF